MSAALPDWRIVVIALVYSVGAHGIITLNDFKSVEVDRQLALKSLPLQLGVNRAAKLACIVMTLLQLIVAALLAVWGHPIHAGIAAILLIAQLYLMKALLADPRGQAANFNATGTTLYVLGLLAGALALRKQGIRNAA